MILCRISTSNDILEAKTFFLFSTTAVKFMVPKPYYIVVPHKIFDNETSRTKDSSYDEEIL